MGNNHVSTSRHTRALVGGAAVLLLASCTVERTTSNSQPPVVSTEQPDDTGRPRESGGPGESVQPYQSFGDCDAFLDWTKERMLERVTPYGLDGWGYWGNEGGMPVDDAAEAPAATEAPQAGDDSASTGDGDGGTSGTNTQEVGVDEGDLSETDGRFVYSVIDNMLRSVDLREQTVVYEESVPEGEHQMILSGDQLLLVSQAWNSSGAETVVTVHDVEDGVPQLRERRHLEGYLLATRAIDGVARIVLRAGITERIPFVRPNFGTEESEQTALERNKQVIEDLEPDQLLPRTFTVGAKGQRGPTEVALECEGLGHPGDFSGFGLTWVATLDMGDPDAEVDGTGGIIADAQTVYASGRNLYVGTMRWSDSFGEVVPVNPDPPHTDVHMFDLTETDSSAYLASGEVQGTVLNQYSMSEHEGHLRVATTTQGWGFGQEQASGVHVLEMRGDELVEVGAVTGLGLGEQIQAVRFQGDVGYVVTFRQVDPLYVLDLSDPRSPTMEGELKIPGYSTYLHPIGDGLVIGIGFAGTDDGQITGTQMSLFDVSDPADPRLVDTLDLGDASEATFDPHAFLYWPETRQVVVPRELECDGAVDSGDTEPNTTGCESAIVVQVEGRELVEQGRLFQWFPIRRSMIASGDLVTLSAGGALVSDLATLDELADIRFDIPGTDAEDDLP
jgi:hypothetical protein